MSPALSKMAAIASVSLVLQGSAVGTSWADDGPSRWRAEMEDEHVEIGAEDRTERGRSESVSPRHLVTVSRFLPRCQLGAEPIMARNASCEPPPCVVDDGREGEEKSELSRKIDATTRKPVTEWVEIGIQCFAKPAANQSLESLILQEFRSLKLPGLIVRTRPAGRTLVNLPTEFAVERPARDREFPRILGHRVTVAITPVRYRWTFGDGATATTSGRGAESVRHTYTGPGSVAASVETSYRARFRVDGGGSRKIPGTVTVPGPATAVEVAQARSQLVAPPNPQ